MSNKIKIKPDSLTRREFVLFTGSTAVAMITVGCGGTSGTSSGSALGGRGKVALTITWPKRESASTSRYIPAYAQSLVFELYKQDAPQIRYSLVANRPDDKPSVQQLEFSELLTKGTYILAGSARISRDGQGGTVASALTSLDVAANQVASAELTLSTTIRAIEILGQPLKLSIGESLTLTGRALDPDGKVLFLPGGALSWGQISGSDFGSVTPEGIFTAKSIGSARIRLAEVGANISNEANIEIINRSGSGGLANSAWPKFRGDARNTGRSSGSGATGIKKWEFATGGPIGSSPAIGVDGTVYSGSYYKLYAIDGSTGVKKWEFTTGGAIYTSPAIGLDGTVYIGSNYSEPYTAEDAKLYALDGSTGAKKWEFITGRLIFASPAIGIDGTVYISSRTYIGNYFQGTGGFYYKLYALDGSTGVKKWEFIAGDDIGSCPAIGADGTVYIGSADRKFYALDGSTGVKKWEFATGGQISYSPTIGADGTVYFGSGDGNFYALDGSTGVKKWNFDFNGNDWPVSDPAIGLDGTVYVVITIAGTPTSNLYALDGTTGVPKWKLFIERNAGSPAIGADNTVYIGVGASGSFTNDSKVYALDGSTGVKKWEFALMGLQASSPAIGSDGTVYVGSGYKLYAIR